jgi:predicted Zn-dependent peptidase
MAGGKVSEFTLPNGLRIIHKEINTDPLVTAEFFIKGGSLAETEKQAGIVNFTQSLMAKETKNRSVNRLALDIEALGTGIHTDVSDDYASLGVSVIKENVEKALEILSDILENPAFSEDEIEKERVNILAGIKRRKDSIFRVTDDLFNEKFYGSHPYAWPASGRKESVAGFQREDLVGWHKKHYSAGNMFLVVAGDISLKDVKKLAKRYFSGLESSGTDFEPPEVKSPLSGKISKESARFQQAYLMIGYPAPASDHEDYPVLKVINTILGGRMTSRLFVELREKLSLGYEVSSFYPSRKCLSRFVVYLGLEKENLRLAEDRISQILSELKKEYVSDEELEETKNYIKGVFLLDHQTIGKQAWYIGWWEIMGKGYEYDTRYLNELSQVTKEDIKRAANKYFNENPLQVEIIPE